ncbi:MAG TPA: VCBS repeat-containing protein [Pyrinomonadaceae bacterium]|jgi:hypothetical protein
MKNYSKLFLTAVMIFAALASVRAAAPANDNFANAQNLGSAHTGSITGNNFEATQEPDEPMHYTTNPNKQSVWYKWTAPASRSMAFEITEENFASAIAIYTSNQPNPTFAQLTKVESNSDILGYNYKGSRINFFALSGKTYYIAVDFGNAGGPGEPTGSFELKYFPNALAYSTRFDARNHRASVSVYRPSNSMWYFLWNYYSIDYQTLYGKPGDTPMPADYNGDGRTDIAIVRNENGAKVWYASFVQTIVWGLPTDQPLIGDFDDDGRADLTAVRKTDQNLVWYVRRSATNSMISFAWGMPTDKPVVGDFDGDRLTDVTVTRSTPEGLVWYILRSNGGNYDQYTALTFGVESDELAVEDFDGDGKTDVAVYRPSNGTWYIHRSATNELQITPFGVAGDQPQPADYDGDGKADLAVARLAENKWFFWMSGSNTQKIVHWGMEADIPTTSLPALSR